MSRFRAAAASAALAAAIVAVAFRGRAGTELERTASSELLLVAAGAVAVVVALLVGSRRRVHGAWAVVAFAALAVLTALSIGWSIAPDLSYLESGRTAAYLAVFAGAVALAQLAPTRADVVLRAILLATLTVAVYGLVARVWPASFSEMGLTGRIALPFDYWNALAGAAAVGVVPALWLGARRSGAALGRALAYPALGVLIATVLIAQSRGALLGAVVACLAWLAIVPLRLRSLGLLLAAAAGAAPVAVWALSKEPFRSSVGLPRQEAVAGDFGGLLLAMVVLLLVAGLAVEAVRARRGLSTDLRVRLGGAVVAVALLAGLALATAVATSERGLGGTVADRVDDLTSESSAPPEGGARLASVSSSRGGYWREAWGSFAERPVAGLGAGSFQIARLAHRNSALPARRAHGFLPQTLADLGIAGTAVVLVLLAAWLAAAARATGVGPRRWIPPTAWTSERAALVALALAAVAYGVQSAIDWTWFVPGLTATALLAAGFVAGRGPLPRIGALQPRPQVEDGHAVRLSVGRLLAIAVVAVVALLSAWTIWQPVRADRSVIDAYELLERGDARGALELAERARERNPFSSDPRYAKASAFATLGRDGAALLELRRAVGDRPRDPNAWLRIATFALHTLDSPRLAAAAAGRALAADPHSRLATGVRQQAADALAQRR